MDKGVLKDVVLSYGSEAQLNQLQEECAELIVAVNHLRRKNDTESLENFYEEIADVSIMVAQMEIIFGADEINRAKERKMKRLEGRLANRRLQCPTL